MRGRYVLVCDLVPLKKLPEAADLFAQFCSMDLELRNDDGLN